MCCNKRLGPQRSLGPVYLCRGRAAAVLSCRQAAVRGRVTPYCLGTFKSKCVLAVSRSLVWALAGSLKGSAGAPAYCGREAKMQSTGSQRPQCSLRYHDIHCSPSTIRQHEEAVPCLQAAAYQEVSDSLAWQSEHGISRLAHWHAQYCTAMAPSRQQQGDDSLACWACKRLGFSGVAVPARLATHSCCMTLHQRCSLGFSILLL